jgi:hypothetical protein
MYGLFDDTVPTLSTRSYLVYKEENVGRRVVTDCEYGTWSVAWKDEHTWVFENCVIRGNLGPERGEWQEANEEIHKSYFSPNIIIIMKSRILRWAGNVTSCRWTVAKLTNWGFERRVSRIQVESVTVARSCSAPAGWCYEKNRSFYETHKRLAVSPR